MRSNLLAHSQCTDHLTSNSFLWHSSYHRVILWAQEAFLFLQKTKLDPSSHFWQSLWWYHQHLRFVFPFRLQKHFLLALFTLHHSCSELIFSLGLLLFLFQPCCMLIFIHDTLRLTAFHCPFYLLFYYKQSLPLRLHTFPPRTPIKFTFPFVCASSLSFYFCWFSSSFQVPAYHSIKPF